MGLAFRAKATGTQAFINMQIDGWMNVNCIWKDMPDKKRLASKYQDEQIEKVTRSKRPTSAGLRELTAVIV